MNFGADRRGRCLESRLGQSAIALSCCLAAAVGWYFMAYPLAGLLVGLAPLAVLVALSQPFLMCLGFIVFSFFRLHEVFPALYPLHIPQLLAMATLAALFGRMAFGRMPMFWSRELTAFAVFFVLVTIGVAAATNRAVAASSWSDTFVKIAVMVFAIAWLAEGPRQFAMTARAVLSCGIVVGAVALYNKINGIGLVEGSRVTIGRDLGSMLGDPNDLSLVLLFPASFALARLSTPGLKGWERAFGAMCFATVFLAILATQSRGGLLGIAAVIGVFAYRRVRSKVFFAVLGGLVLAGVFALAGISERASGGAAEIGIDQSAMGRLYAWEAALRMAVSHPLTGVGLNNFLPNYYAYSDFWDGSNHAVHSTWLGVLAETGWLGLAVFVTLIVLVLRTALATVRGLSPEAPATRPYNPEAYAAAQAMLGGLVGFVVSGTFLTQGFTWPLYVLLALTVAIARYMRSQSAPADT